MKKVDDGSCMNESGQGSSQRKKKVVTNCVHVDREFYAKGMCKPCYHRLGRTKPASCHPDKIMYALGLCHCCYMQQYGKKKRIENKNAKVAALQMIEPTEKQPSEKTSSKKSITKRPTN